MPFFLRNLATISLPYPLAMAEQSSMICGFCFLTCSSSSATFWNPTIARRLSTVCWVGGFPVLNPNPQAFTIGATVMSNAPSVSLDIFSASWKTSANILSTFTSSLRLILEMMDVLLNGERELSTFCSSASISFW